MHLNKMQFTLQLNKMAQCVSKRAQNNKVVAN